jgi:hypothetical protein
LTQRGVRCLPAFGTAETKVGLLAVVHPQLDRRPRKLTPLNDRAGGHFAALAYNSLHEKPAAQPSTGPSLLPAQVEHFSVPETGALFGSC